MARQSIPGILLLAVFGLFIFKVYQQAEVFGQIHRWLGSWPYIFQGIDESRMQQKLKIQQLNNAIPPLDKIFNASFSGALSEADMDKCTYYYHLVLENMPQMKEAHVLGGFCEAKAGHLPQAFVEFREGLESPAAFWASYNLAVLAMSAGNKDAARVLFFQTARLSVPEVMKNIFSSRLFQQYIQANHMTPQQLFKGISEAREAAVQNLKSMEEGGPLNPARLRIF